MFITVKYGDGGNLLCNPDCKADVLLDDIRRRCSYEKGVMVDLSDESGNLKFLSGHPESYATDFLKNRESLVLVRVEKNPEDDAISYTPLLDDVFIVTSAFIDRLSRCGDAAGAKPSQGKNGSNASSFQNNVKKQQAVSKARSSFLTSANKTRNPNRSSSRNQSNKDKTKSK